MLTLDDDNLVKLFEALNPKQRKQAIQGALRRAATKVKKEAVKNLRSARNGKGETIKTSKELEKGIRRLAYKKHLGFRVTVGSKKKAKTKPILVWAEEGTKKRFTKTQTKVYRRKRGGHYTGEMPRYGFMQRTKEQVKDKVTDMLHNEINQNIQRIAKKYGCRVT